jgi:hypothetical protein
MSKKVIKSNQNQSKVHGPVIKKNKISKQTVVKNDLLAASDHFLSKHTKKIFWIGLALSCLFGALLFDIKISEGTDDSGYVMAAHDFILGKAFPTWHGSFYPIFLSPFMLIFGMDLFVLKFVSYLLMAGHFIFLYLALKDRVRPTILSLVVLITAINSYILYHASSTYSEPLYFFLQSLTIFFFFTLMDKLDKEPDQHYKQWKNWLAFGFCGFLLSITRNIGVGIFITVIVYFAINRRFKEILWSIGSFLVFQIPYSLYKTFYWHLKDAGFEAQLQEMYYKNPYSHAIGTENFQGFIIRFLQNSELYLSKHFYKILGLQASDSIDKSVVLTILSYLLFLLATITALKKKNKYMQFIALYLAVAIGATFITQQVFWDQVRLILVYVPLILVLFSYGIYELSTIKKYKFIQPFFLLFFIIVFFASFKQTSEKAKINNPILEKNMEGDRYFGFTPDWVHYFQISEWAAKNLPKDAVIVCRKPSMSFIYAKGRDFFGLYKIPMVSVDSVNSNLAKRKADIIIVENSEIESKKFPTSLFDICRPFNRFVVMDDQHSYTIYEPTPDKKELILSNFKQYKIGVNTNLEAFIKQMKSAKESYAEDADQLLKFLKDNHISYILLGSLRANPNEKNGNIIDTMQRLVFFIQLKYPNLFTQIHQIGTDDDEPAQVVKVNL